MFFALNLHSSLALFTDLRTVNGKLQFRLSN